MKGSKQRPGSGNAPTSARARGNQPGGGLGSRVINPQGQRLGQPAKGVGPGGVSQLGEAIGNHITDRRGTSGYKGDPMYTGPGPVNSAQPLGNQLATNVGKGGPGAGREVMRSGSQGQQGSAAPGSPRPEASRPIFPGFK
jgi:hypothetical protein